MGNQLDLISIFGAVTGALEENKTDIEQSRYL